MSIPIHHWTHEPVSSALRRGLERLARVPGVVHLAVMPDVYQAEHIGAGLVLGAEDWIFPEAVGGDIGCGVGTVRLRGDPAPLIEGDAGSAVLHGLGRLVPILRHPRGRAAVLDEDLPEASGPGAQTLLERLGPAQLGTLGRGNHFLELQLDEQGALWIMVHSGSRGLGPALRDLHRVPGPLAGLRADGAEGRVYLQDVALARAFARASRERMLLATAALLEQLLGLELEPDSHLDIDHNHVQCEEHGGRALWVHRKGAIAAARGQAGLVPGSMGDVSYHTVGKGEPDALGSSSHGAGRRMSRREARNRYDRHAVADQCRGVVVDPRQLRSLGEEAPRAYKRIDQVMKAQRELCRPVRRLRPLLSYRGGSMMPSG
jgi:tRNA-splicing ligase RtcB